MKPILRTLCLTVPRAQNSPDTRLSRFRRLLRLLPAPATYVLLALLLASPLMAQIDAGRILGMVKDQSGAVVPGAKVTVTNEGTGLALNITTGPTGYFVFPALRIGSYRVEVEVAGFAKFVRSGLTLHVQEDVVVDATLVPGAVTQTIEVKAAAPVLQTQDASVGTTVGTQVVNDLPLNGRNWTTLVELGAGVTYSQPDASGRPYFSANGHPLEQNDYRLNGINNNDEAWTLPEPYVALPPPDAIAEFKVQTNNYNAEFGHSGGAVINASTKSGTNQIHGDVWEYVRNDKFDAAQYFENSSGLTKGAYRQNQFGATLGGPVVLPHVYDGKDKSFFFFSYQGTRIRQALTRIDTVPTSSMVSSGFTDMQDLITYTSGTRSDSLGRTFPLGTVFDPATTRSVTAGQADPVTNLIAATSGFVRDPFYQGSLTGLTNFTSPAIVSQLNRLPAGRLDANGKSLLGVYPAANLPGFYSDYAYDGMISNNTNQVDWRVDHNFGPKDQLFLVGSWSHTPLNNPGYFPGLGGAGQWFDAGLMDERAEAYAVSETHFFSPTTINEVRLGFSRSPISMTGPYGHVMGIPEKFGIQGIPQVDDNGGLPPIDIAGLTGMGTAGWIPTVGSSVTWDLTENLTKVYGAHTFKAGFQGDYIQTPILQPAWSHGGFDFGGAYTEVPNTGGGGTGMAQLLLTPSASSVPGGYDNVGGADTVYASNFAADSYRREYYGMYFQDDWKVTPKLTLNLGIRWDHTTPYGESFGAMANFLPGAPGNGAEFLIPQKRCSQPLSSSFTTLTKTDGITVKCISNNELGTAGNVDFAPRVGIAYSFTPKLVARAGFGIFYGALGSLGYGNTLGNAYPFLFNFYFFNPDAAHPVSFPDGSLGTLETGLSGINFSPAAVDATGLSLTGRQFNSNAPYYEDYNAALQYQLTPNQSLELMYVGDQGHHMNQYISVNEPTVILPPGLNPQNYVPYPDFGRGSPYEMDGANTYYHSFQATYERRFSGGLNLLANYTLSKCRSDWRSAALSTVGGFRADTLPGFGITGDYSYCDADVPNLFHFSGLWTVPIGSGHHLLGASKGIANEVLGGWKLNWIVTLEDGMPFNIGCPIGTTADYGCYALLVPGQNIYGGSHNVNQWINPAAFANPPVATSIGQSDFAPLGGSPTQAHGPGEHRLDFSMFKEFPVTESKRLEFRAEFFNLTNTPWFANPAYTDFTNPATFGQITSLRDGANDPRQIQFALKFYF
jgi:carboxypeptidase family protein/TonB-dependent receptor-like protein